LSKFWNTGDTITESKMVEIEKGLGTRGKADLLKLATLSDITESSGDFEISTTKTSGTIEALLNGSTIRGYNNFKLDISNLDANNNLYYEVKKRTFITTAYATSYDSSKVTRTTLSGVDLNIYNNGSRVFLVSSSSIKSHTLSTPYDMSTASYDSKSFAPSDIKSGSSLKYKIANGGAKLFCLYTDDTGDDLILLECTMSTPYDLSTATEINSLEVPSTSVNGGSPTILNIKPDGSRIWFKGGSINLSYIDLSTPFDLSTAGSVTDLGVGIGAFIKNNTLVISNTGDRLFTVERDSATDYHINIVTLSTAWDLTTYSTETEYDVSDELEVSGLLFVSGGIFFSENGDKFYLLDTTYVYSYSSASSFRILGYNDYEASDTSIIAQTEITENDTDSNIDLSSLSQLSADEYLLLKLTLTRGVAGDTSPTLSNGNLNYTGEKNRLYELGMACILDDSPKVEIDLHGYDAYRIVFVGDVTEAGDKINVTVNDNVASKLTVTGTISTSVKNSLDVVIKNPYLGNERIELYCDVQSANDYTDKATWESDTIITSVEIEVDHTSNTPYWNGQTKYVVYGMYL